MPLLLFSDLWGLTVTGTPANWEQHSAVALFFSLDENVTSLKSFDSFYRANLDLDRLAQGKG